MTVDQYDDSIRIAVERETQRRKRVLMFFVALLALPLIAGAWALAKAPSETEAVAREVTPLVRESVSKSVAEDVAAQAAPLIEERVARSVDKELEPKLAELRTQVDAKVAAIQPFDNAQLAAQVQKAVETEVTARVAVEVGKLKDVHEREINELKARLKMVENPATIRPRPIR